MDQADKDLQELVATGKAQGYLTYDQVNEYLPDEAVNPDKLDNLLMALEDQGIELVNEPPEVDFSALAEVSDSGDDRPLRPRRHKPSEDEALPDEAAAHPVRRHGSLERRPGPDVSDADGRDSVAGAR